MNKPAAFIMMNRLDTALQLDRIAINIAIDMADQFSPGFCGNVMVENFAEIVKKHINTLKLEQETKDTELRDHFAGLALSGLAGMDGYIGLEYIAIDAYALADAMIAERGKRNE